MSESGNHQPRLRYGRSPPRPSGSRITAFSRTAAAASARACPRRVRACLQQRDLPQVHADVASMQLVDHALRIGPRPVGRKLEVREPMR